MDPIQEQQLNQAAFLQLSSFISNTYPQGRFVAIADGNILADADSFKELNSMLHQQGNHFTEVLIVQAGVDYSEPMTIFI